MTSSSSFHDETRNALSAAEEAWAAQNPDQLRAAFALCERTLVTLPPETTTGPADAATLVPDEFSADRASLWLWRGRFLVSGETPKEVVEGLNSLDQAIARFRHALVGTPDNTDEQSIAWMNRGSGLFRLGNPEALAEGLRSYDQVISLWLRWRI